MIDPSPPITWSKPFAPLLDLGGPTNVYRSFPQSSIERPAIDLFRQVAEEFGGRIACEDGESRLTYGQTWTACRRLAAEVGNNVPLGQAVGVLLPNEASYPVAVLACLAAGSPCVMIDRHHPADRIAAIIRDSRLAAVILKRTDLDGSLLLPAGIRTLVIDDALREGAASDLPSITAVPSDAPSFIVYTSGSTGQPKGIALSQRAVLHRASQLINSVHLRPDDKVLSLASPSTIGGLQQIFEVMLSGASLVKLDLQRVGLGSVVSAIASRRISMMFSTPAVWRSIARIEGAADALTSLRCIQSSGDALLRVDLEEARHVLPPDCHVLSVYGATEAPALLQWFVSPTVPADEVRVPAGYVLGGFALALLDDSGRVVPDGEPGELVVKSPWMSVGLWRDGRVLPGPFERDVELPEVPIYRTGDIVRRRPDGLYITLGRKDRQVKIRGNRVELAEIETALRRLPICAEAAVVARRTVGEPRLWAFVVPRDSAATANVGVLRRHLSEVLPSYMRPSEIFLIDELPLLPGRKIDEEALVAHASKSSDPKVSAPAAALASPRATDIVSRAWRRTLGRRPPADDSSFDEMDGDSLRLLQLIFHIERLSGRSLPLERFPGELRPSQFALELDRFIQNLGPERPADLPVVYLVPGVGGDEPQLAQFRAACSDEIDMRVVEYPPLGRLAGGTFDDIVTHIASHLEQAAGDGAIALAGYSMGGDVAYAVAESLGRRGRSVSVLCILDTNTTGREPEPPPRGRIERRSPLARLFQIFSRGVWNELVAAMLPAKVVARPSVQTLLRGLLVFRWALPQNVDFFLSRHLSEALVRAHHDEWIRNGPTSRLDAPIVLFRSEQSENSGLPDDLGWGLRTRDLKIVNVRGSHFTMLSRENNAILREEFIRTVTASLRDGNKNSQEP